MLHGLSLEYRNPFTEFILIEYMIMLFIFPKTINEIAFCKKMGNDEFWCHFESTELMQLHIFLLQHFINYIFYGNLSCIDVYHTIALIFFISAQKSTL